MSRDIWFKRSCSLMQDPELRPVLLSHGPGALTVYEELLALAKLAKCEGEVFTTFALLAERAVVKRPACKRIVAALAEIQFLSVLDMSEDELHVLMSGWKEWNPADPTNARRQAKWRERRNAKDNGESNGPERYDPVSVTALDVRSEIEEPPVAPQGGPPEIPVRPEGNRQRGRQGYLEQCQAYSDYFFPDLNGDGAELVKEAISLAAVPSAHEEIETLVRGWRPAPLRVLESKMGVGIDASEHSGSDGSDGAQDGEVLHSMPGVPSVQRVLEGQVEAERLPVVMSAGTVAPVEGGAGVGSSGGPDAG